MQRKEVESEEQQGEGKKRTDMAYSGRDGELLSWKNGLSSSESSGDENEGNNYSSDDDESERCSLILQEGDYVEAHGLTEGEEAKMAHFMRAPAFQRRTFADLIFEKIREKEAGAMMDEGLVGIDNNELQPAKEEASDLPDKVVEVYTKIGAMLKHYTAGKLPKAFKIIPSLSNWEEVLALTRPDEWTPHAVYAATRIFASNFSPKMAQR